MSTSWEPGLANAETPHAIVPAMVIGPRLLPPGSLATWQARRVRAYVEENLAHELQTRVLAGVVSLSPSHFCRAFKRTFGTTVHRFVMLSRIEKAQQLMLNTSEPLSSIAVSCGLSDQSHLTRWFRRVFGVPPAAWRRARFEPSAGADPRPGRHPRKGLVQATRHSPRLDTRRKAGR